MKTYSSTALVSSKEKMQINITAMCCNIKTAVHTLYFFCLKFKKKYNVCKTQYFFYFKSSNVI